MFGRFCLALAITLLIAPCPATADDRPSQNCGDLATGGEQKQCAETQFRKATDELKAAYGRVLERAAKPDGNAAVIASQQAWEAYRDAECRGVVGRGGGSGRMVWVLGCLTEKADARTRELNVPYDAR
jgi:uncharacterized protein YecT (DUF1311 family)